MSLARISAHRHRLALCAVLLGATPALAHAAAAQHVKWFAQFSFADKPNTLTETLTPLLFVLTALSMIVISALVPVDSALQQSGAFKRLESWLEARKGDSTLVMRIAIGATLLLSWQADSVLAPDLKISAFGAFGPVLGWAQFGLALLLIFEKSTPLAGIGIGVLYLLGVFQFGPFYMLDYAHYIGIALFLALSNVSELRVRAMRLPVLYASVGFALIWLGLEKMVYPDWSRYVVQQNPQLALGLPVDFFVKSAAFVEVSLGYLLIICLFERPLALVITLVFFTTTLVFGKVEVIGHTSVHAALIVFLLNGPGTVYRAPITFHSRPQLRAAFGAVNFAVVCGVLLLIYTAGAWSRYQRSIAALPLQHVTAAPALDAWQSGNTLHVSALGHNGEMVIYVDGELAGTVSNGRFNLSSLPAGAHRIVAVLSTRDERFLAVAGEPVAKRLTVLVD
jgi:hypothetical protein